MKRVSIGGAVMFLVALSALAVSLDYLPGEPSLTRGFQANAPSWVEPFMSGVSRLGGTVPLLGLLAVASAVLLYKKREYALAPVIVMLTGALVPLAKEVISRPRPADDLVEVLILVHGNGFPSGHAFMSMTTLGAIFYLAGHLSGGVRWVSFAIRVSAAVSIAAIGASRVYLGAHWTSDVIGGYLMGGLALGAAIFVFERVAERRRLGAGWFSPLRHKG